MGIRDFADLLVPGALVGCCASAFAGTLCLLAGQPLGWAAITAVGLGIPLAAWGAGYTLLLAKGRFRTGVFAPAALYWFVGFPLARLIQETTASAVLDGRLAAPPDPLAFLAYQALVSVGFAIGFLWLHERIAPRWLSHIQHRNPVAARLLAGYVGTAGAAMLTSRSRPRNTA